MRSVYIITGGILVMMAVVLLAPQKQNKTEEKEAGQIDETEAIIREEYGDDLSPEDKEIVYETIAEELALEKAEIKKYGRLLTDEERFQLEWQAEEKARQEAEFAEFYDERKDWIDNFPFRPGYHPDILYDPENIAHSDAKFHAYQKELERKGGELWHERGEKSRAIWARTDLTIEEKPKQKTNSGKSLKNSRNPTRKSWRNGELSCVTNSWPIFTNSTTAIYRSSSKPTASLKKKVSPTIPFGWRIPWSVWKTTL